MEIEEILRELDTIFRDILKNENITLTTETTAKDVDGWDSLTNMRLITATCAHPSKLKRNSL